MTNMEVNKEKPIEEKSDLPLTGEKPAGIIPYMDKLRVRNLYGFNWSQYEIAGSLTEAQKTDLTDGGASTLHKHDHGGMDGLDGDDHAQYHNDARGDARYYTETETDAFAVKLTGAQTIADVKTFSSFPVTPSADPTTDYQVANKKYADGIAAGIANVAMNAVETITPANNDTTNITVGFTPKFILFYAISRDGNAGVLFSNGTAIGTADAQNSCTWGDSLGSVVADKNGGATTGKCISIMDEGSTLISGQVTTIGSTTTITWEVITSTDIAFSWTALA